VLRELEDAGVARVMFMLPSVAGGELERALDDAAALAGRAR
jgi:hypothetical protein